MVKPVQKRASLLNSLIGAVFPVAHLGLQRRFENPQMRTTRRQARPIKALIFTMVVTMSAVAPKPSLIRLRSETV